MAFTANTAFEARITNGRFNDLANITGKYQSSAADADCDAGHLCVAVSLLDCEGFSSVKNENAWLMNDAVDTTTFDTPIYACNSYATPLAPVKTNLYEVGNEFLGLGVPAGRYGTFTRIYFDGESSYRFGVGNLSTTLSTNGFATIDDGQLVPAASAPATAGTPYFIVKGTGKFVEGTSESFGYVDVIATKVSA